MPISRDEIETFFADYGAALVGRDARTVASYWAVPALVLADSMETPVARIEEVEGFFASAMGQYAGIEGAEARVQSAMSLSAGISGADIVWTLRTSGGDVAGTEQGFYVLKRSGGRVRIHVYVPAATHVERT